jgi:DNA topoisomerase-3
MTILAVPARVFLPSLPRLCLCAGAMAKQLVITEKPSVARDIVAALGGFSEDEGFWENDELVVTFAVGHLLELPSPEDLDPKYKRWTLDTLPIIPEKFDLKAKPDQGERLRTIKKLAKREDVEGLINACDAGREGELIFREIVDYHRVEKPIRRLWLQSMTKDAIRTGFRSLKPGEAYQGLRDAAYCRTHADWLIGMNATRALTRRLKTRAESQAWSAGRVQTPTLAMLVGREIEILAHVPEAYWRIVAQLGAPGHVYTASWFDPDYKSAEDDRDRGRADRIFDEAKALAIVEKVRGKPGVASETRKPSREAAPPLFDLTSLQREANRRFGWSARRTLNAAQRCYEVHKVLTYPRTDARCLPEDYRPVVDEVIEALGRDPRFAAGSAFLRKNGRQNENKIFDDSKVSDHFAIVPTGEIPDRVLDGDDGRLFDLVTRRFLAAFHPAALWSRVERITVIEGESFRSRARTLQEPGWRAVMGETEVHEGDGALPPLVTGKDEADGVAVESRELELLSEETKPPARITEGRLLSLMETAGEQLDDEDAAEVLKDKGIGTPATRADIIENLIRKGYADRVGKALRPSVKGIRLIDILKRMHAERLASAQLTGDIENHLLEVERQRRSPDVFMEEIREYATEIVERTKTFEFEQLFPDDESLGACPICKRDVYERSWFYRCKEPADLEAQRKAHAEWKKLGKKAKAETPEPEVSDCPFRIWKDKSGRYIDRNTVRELLSSGGTRVLDGFSTRSGRSYRAQLFLDDEFKIELKGVADSGDADADEASGGPTTPEYEVDDAPLAPCPVCKEGQWVETRSTFLCDRGLAALKAAGKDDATVYPLKPREIPEGTAYCAALLPRTVCRREITRDEALGFLRDGKTAILEEFISKKGRPFSATLVMKPENGRHSFEFPPRGGAKADGEGGATKKATTKKKAAKKAGTKKATTKKKVAKKAGTKKATTKKKAAKKAGTKKASAKKTAAAPSVES